MIEWMTAHPWMTFTVLALIASGFRFTFTLPIGGQGEGSAGGEASPQDRPLVTPDEARLHMLTPRELSAKTIADAIAEFCEDGDPGVPIEFANLGDPDIAELLRYRDAGWVVKFDGEGATISLPAVLS